MSPHDARGTKVDDHPNIVPVFDIGEEAGQVYIVCGDQELRAEGPSEAACWRVSYAACTAPAARSSPASFSPRELIEGSLVPRTLLRTR